jgi:hypothetical protein
MKMSSKSVQLVLISLLLVNLGLTGASHFHFDETPTESADSGLLHVADKDRHNPYGKYVDSIDNCDLCFGFNGLEHSLPQVITTTDIAVNKSCGITFTADAPQHCSYLYYHPRAPPVIS